MFVVGTPKQRGADPAGMGHEPALKDVTRTYLPRTSSRALQAAWSRSTRCQPTGGGAV